VAEEVGDDDQVGAAAYESGGERVAQHVGHRDVVEAMVMMSCAPFTDCRRPRWLRNSAGT